MVFSPYFGVDTLVSLEKNNHGPKDQIAGTLLNLIKVSLKKTPNNGAPHLSSFLLLVSLHWFICAMVKPVSFFWGWETPPTFNDGILISWGPINPYLSGWWVYPLLYGNNGSLDPGTFRLRFVGVLIRIFKKYCPKHPEKIASLSNSFHKNHPMRPRKKTLRYFPLYWLISRDPYKCLLIIPT